MVSYRGRELRVHEGYLAAPPEVLAAIVTFVSGRTAPLAGSRVVAFSRTRSRALRGRGDRMRHIRMMRRSRSDSWTGIAGSTTATSPARSSPSPVRVSRRMRARLGHYMSAAPSGEPAEIVVSRRHIRRHGWGEALHTLLHEMVHQWQDETGHPIDHGRLFRAKAGEVGVAPSARRTVTPLRSRKDLPSQKNAPGRSAAFVAQGCAGGVTSGD